MAIKTWIATTASTWATAASWSPAGVPVAADDVIFNGTYNGDCSVGAAATCKSLVMTGYGGVFSGASTLAITGSSTGTQGNFGGTPGNTLILSASGSTTNFTYSGAITFTATNGSGYIACNGKTISGSVTFNDVLGAWDTSDVFTCTSTLTLTTSSWVYFNYDAYIGNISTSNSNSRYIGFFADLYLTGAGSLINTLTTTNLGWFGGTVYVWGSQASARTLTLNTFTVFSYVYLAGNGSGSITLAVGTTAQPLVYVTNTGGAVVSFTTGTMTSLTFNAGTNVIWNNNVNNTITILGDLILTSSMASPILTPSFIFTGGAPGCNITLAGKSLVTGTVTLNDTIVGAGTFTFTDVFSSNAAVTITSAGSVNVNAALSCTSFTHTAGTVTANAGITTTTGAYTFSAGTLNLGSSTHNFFSFVSSNSNTRTINFGTSTVNITGNAATIWNTGTVTSLTISGTSPTVNFIYSGSTGTRTISVGALLQANSINVNINAGADTILTTGNFNDLNFTGFSGAYNCSNAINIYRDLTFSSSQTISGTSNVNFIGASITQTITPNGIILTCPIVINSATTTFQNSGVLNTTNNITLTSGTFNINANLITTGGLTLTAGIINVNNGVNITCGGFNSNNSNVRTLNMGWNTWSLTGTGTVWNVTPTNLTFNAQQSRILINNTTNLTTTTAFSGGGLTYYTVEYARGAATANFNVSGSNTYANFIDNTSTVAHTISWTSGTTQTFYKFNVRGSAGALITMARSSATTVNFVKVGQGIVSGCDYILANSSTTATPANTWYLGANGSTGGGGWILGNAPSSQSLLGAGGVG